MLDEYFLTANDVKGVQRLEKTPNDKWTANGHRKCPKAMGCCFSDLGSLFAVWWLSWAQTYFFVCVLTSLSKRFISANQPESRVCQQVLTGWFACMDQVLKVCMHRKNIQNAHYWDNKAKWETQMHLEKAS